MLRIRVENFVEKFCIDNVDMKSGKQNVCSPRLSGDPSIVLKRAQVDGSDLAVASTFRFEVDFLAFTQRL